MARVKAEALESDLTTIRLNKNWTKTVSAFVNKISHMIDDHKDLTGGKHGDQCHIERLNASFSEHKDMSQHIEHLRATIARVVPVRHDSGHSLREESGQQARSQ